MEPGSVYLTLEHQVGPGALGQYVLELLARDNTVTIRPTPNLIKQLERLRESQAPPGVETTVTQ